MLIDLTTLVTPKITKDAQTNLDKASYGHLGTHFDVMNKEFPLEFIERKGIVYNVSIINGKEIDTNDVDIDLIEKEMFVAFYSGYIESEPYGTEKYFKEHPQLSNNLIDVLIQKGISIIGIDFAGVRRGKEHTPMDQYCADRGVFIVENLCNLNSILINCSNASFLANTYPMNFEGMTGLPCRVVAKI
jgi:kynurenine formamidase